MTAGGGFLAQMQSQEGQHVAGGYMGVEGSPDRILVLKGPLSSGDLYLGSGRLDKTLHSSPTHQGGKPPPGPRSGLGRAGL